MAAGFGYSLIPQLAAQEDDRLRKLIRYRSFDGKPVGRTILLVCRERFGLMADIELLASFIRETLPRGVTLV